MDNSSLTTGGFTLPGEAGYEDLTLRLAEKWGADVIRDSDGTQLSDRIYTSSPNSTGRNYCLRFSGRDQGRENARAGA